MYILGIDTASNRCSIALSHGYDILFSQYNTTSESQVENILSIIELALKNTQIKAEDLNYLAVTQGPGSFSGIRIGLATALGFNIGLQLSTVVLSNLEVIKFLILTQVKKVDFAFSVINAYKGKVYIQKFHLHDQLSYKPLLVDIEIAADMLLESNSQIVCSGNGTILIYDFYIQKFQNNFSNKIIYLPRYCYHDARPVCRLAYKQILNNNYSSELIPLYIRPPDVNKNL